MISKHKKRILVWGNDFNSLFVFNGLKSIYKNIDIIDIDKKFVYKLNSIMKNDIIYIISAKLGLSIIIGRILGKKIVIHWVGTDMIKYSGSNIFIKLLYRVIANKNIFVNKNLLNEYSKSKKADIFPILRKEMLQKSDFSIKKDILAYVPSNREDFYYGYFLTHFFKKRRKYRLHIIGNEGIRIDKAKNIKYYGWVSKATLNSLIKKCSVYIRFVKHDGFSKLIANNMYNYNFVIYNKPFPYTINCTPEESILDNALTNIYKKHSLKKSNHKQHEYIEKLYSEFNYHHLLEVILAG